MSALQPFNPKYGSGQAVAPAAASAVVPIEATNGQVRVTNTGAAIGFFRTFSSKTVAGTPSDGVATAADMSVPPGMSVTVTKSLLHDQLAHISATGTTFQIITGDGW